MTLRSSLRAAPHSQYLTSWLLSSVLESGAAATNNSQRLFSATARCVYQQVRQYATVLAMHELVHLVYIAAQPELPIGKSFVSKYLSSSGIGWSQRLQSC